MIILLLKIYRGFNWKLFKIEYLSRDWVREINRKVRNYMRKDILIRDLEATVEAIKQVARHIYYARACLLDGNPAGHKEHLDDALNLLGIREPKDVQLSNRILEKDSSK